jgi:hypothetical protein
MSNADPNPHPPTNPEAKQEPEEMCPACTHRHKHIPGPCPMSLMSKGGAACGCIHYSGVTK